MTDSWPWAHALRHPAFDPRTRARDCPSMASHQIDQREYADPDDIQRVPKQAPAQQTTQHSRSEPLNEYLGHQIDERDQTAGDVDAVCAYQGEEAGEKGAARGARPFRHHAGKFD